MKGDKRMDKKSLIIVVILGVILLGIITTVFIFDAKVNTTVVDINGLKYSKEDFESYLKVWQYEKGEEAINKDEMFESYKIYKLYSQYVDRYNINLPSGDEVRALTAEEKTKLETGYNLTENEYMRVKTEIAKVDNLYANLPDYWKVSDEDYEEHKAEYGAEKFKMYDYRVMQVAVEQPEEPSGDVSGDNKPAADVSGETVSGDESGDKELQARKDAAKSKTVEALAKVKSGDSFEDVAKEYGTSRLAYSSKGYEIINGTLESVAGIYMDNYVWDENILKSLKELKKGEYSEIFENENYYMFVYLEDVREGLDAADDLIYKRQIANGHIQGEASIIPGNMIALKSIKLEELIPALKNPIKDNDNQTPEQETPDETVSGENVSGETNTAENNSGDVAEDTTNQ